MNNRANLIAAQAAYTTAKALMDVTDDAIEDGNCTDAEWARVATLLDEAESVLLLACEAALAHMAGAADTAPAYDAAMGRNGRDLSVATRWKMCDLAVRLNPASVAA